MPDRTVKCDRSGPWGNPYHVDDMYASWSRIVDRRERTLACIAHYKRMAEEGFVTVPYSRRAPWERGDLNHSFGAHPVPLVAAGELCGRNLGCWCKLCSEHASGKRADVICRACEPCHVDELILWANPEAAVRVGIYRASRGLLAVPA